jgi:hypothetical protein
MMPKTDKCSDLSKDSAGQPAFIGRCFITASALHDGYLTGSEH